MKKIIKPREIINYFKDWDIDSEFRNYLNYHHLRYYYLVNEVENILVKKVLKKFKILDIGHSFQTEILRNNLPDVQIDSLGFKDPRFPLRPRDKHYQFDLNNSEFKNKWPEIGKYNIIVFSEVIEHLYTSPNIVLNFISSLLKKGGILIIQTPNATALNRRLKLLIGKNPYDLIREERINPGHFREYTIFELINYGKGTGYEIISYKLNNYFTGNNPVRKLYNFISPVLPETLREGITIILKKN